MATRPAKTGASGATTYTGAVAAGATTILAIDVDNDFNEIYTNITNTNIATGAAIATAKLASDAGIVSGMLASNSVTTAKITDLNVTTGKLAVGAAANTATAVAFSAGNITTTTETQLGLTGTLAHRGGTVIISGAPAATLTLAGFASVVLTFRLYNGATGTNLVTSWTAAMNNGNVNPVDIATFTPINYVVGASGNNRWKVTLQFSTLVGLCTYALNVTNPGALCIAELA